MFKMAASAQKKAFCVQIRQDNVSVKCAMTFSGHVMERIRQPRSLSTTGTSVGRAGLSI
jgi:hypothetical protein